MRKTLISFHHTTLGSLWQAHSTEKIDASVTDIIIIISLTKQPMIEKCIVLEVVPTHIYTQYSFNYTQTSC